LPGAGRIEEVERPGCIGRPDVQEYAIRGAAVVGGAAGRLKDIAGDLIYRRIPIGPEGCVPDAGTG